MSQRHIPSLPIFFGVFFFSPPSILNNIDQVACESGTYYINVCIEHRFSLPAASTPRLFNN